MIKKTFLSPLLIISLTFIFNLPAFSQGQNMEKIAAIPGCEGTTGDEAANCHSDKLFEFILSKMVYPQEAVDSRIEGTVIVEYAINAEGKVENLKVTQSVHKLLDDEAMRIMALLPTHDPATLHGRPVSMTFTVPLGFKLFQED